MRTANYQVPFYANTPDDTHCFQAAFLMVLKYFQPGQDLSWKELEKITEKPEGLWTWPTAGLLWLKRNGFEIKYIDPFDYRKFIDEGEQYIIDFYGKEVGDAQIAHSNIAQEHDLAKPFISEINPEARVPQTNEITDLLLEGFLVICNVNSRALNNETGYVGHFVVVKGFGDNFLILHDPGLPPYEDRRIDLQTFERAWAFPDENAKNIMAFKRIV